MTYLKDKNNAWMKLMLCVFWVTPIFFVIKIKKCITFPPDRGGGGHISDVIGRRQGTLFMAKIFRSYCPWWKNAVTVAVQCVEGDKNGKFF